MTAGARRYDSSRRQSTGRERILEAALDLARARGGWNWADITFGAVADAAGVSERTVYRHFATQRNLHEAMLVRINERAAISYDDLTLDGLPEMVERLFRSLSTFAPGFDAHPRPSEAAVAMNQERMQALMRASGGDRRLAAVLDVLWSTEAYERLVLSWRMSTDEAADAIAWALGALVNQRSTAPPSS
jgi:AcrR family transcriptional regulator